MNLSLAKFTSGGTVATDHRLHAWQFELKLGSPLAAAQRTTQLPSDSPLQPFCLCYPLLC
ncbi:hypothetical protein E2C01_045812 [Portunus trituberculatus]|uniref:Uncharacterized protein n=1 Tax=Portunus trituberculatus TaxID=210409 RepID=A0A5B7G606_PORTR|nr:hypothetical protein [Portunus trituberculatus]